MLKTLAGAFLVLLGGSILYRSYTAGAIANGSSAYEQGQIAGQMAGMVFAVILVISGAYLVFKS